MRALFALPDALRRGALRIAAPLVAPLYARRELRVAWLGSIAIVVSLALSLAYPLALLSLGPLLLGVPHLLSDVRYLVVKPRAHARWSLVLFVLVPLAATWVSPTLKVGLVATLGAARIAERRDDRPATTPAAPTPTDVDVAAVRAMTPAIPIDIASAPVVIPPKVEVAEKKKSKSKKAEAKVESTSKQEEAEPLHTTA